MIPASALSLAELADLFTAGYEGYFVPLHVDEAAMRFFVDAWDLDLEHSRVEPGEGVALLGVRGDRGWVGGLGVVPSARRRGLGRALMEAILAEAPPRVRLEVIEQNEPAIALYESLGFRHVRWLEVLSLTAEVDAADVRAVPASPLEQSDLPWQRQSASLPPGYDRVETDGGEMLIKVNGPRVSVLQLHADDKNAARTLLAAARSRGESLHYVNVPAGDPASVALADLGGKLELRQLEMELAG